jgi:hypothetical protein
MPKIGAALIAVLLKRASLLKVQTGAQKFLALPN